MKLTHVYHGRTQQDKYFWFVLFEYDDGAELVITMPENRLTEEINEHFQRICEKFEETVSSGNGADFSVELENLGKTFGFEKWVAEIS